MFTGRLQCQPGQPNTPGDVDIYARLPYICICVSFFRHGRFLPRLTVISPVSRASRAHLPAFSSPLSSLNVLYASHCSTASWPRFVKHDFPDSYVRFIAAGSAHLSSGSQIFCAIPARAPSPDTPDLKREYVMRPFFFFTLATYLAEPSHDRARPQQDVYFIRSYFDAQQRCNLSFPPCVPKVNLEEGWLACRYFAGASAHVCVCRFDVNAALQKGSCP